MISKKIKSVGVVWQLRKCHICEGNAGMSVVISISKVHARYCWLSTHLSQSKLQLRYKFPARGFTFFGVAEKRLLRNFSSSSLSVKIHLPKFSLNSILRSISWYLWNHPGNRSPCNRKWKLLYRFSYGHQINLADSTT